MRDRAQANTYPPISSQSLSLTPAWRSGSITKSSSFPFPFFSCRIHHTHTTLLPQKRDFGRHNSRGAEACQLAPYTDPPDLSPSVHTCLALVHPLYPCSATFAVVPSSLQHALWTAPHLVADGDAYRERPRRLRSPFPPFYPTANLGPSKPQTRGSLQQNSLGGGLTRKVRGLP